MESTNAKQSESRRLRFDLRTIIALVLLTLSIPFGILALALVSNQFGNTDTIGIRVLGFAGWLAGTGYSYLHLSKNLFVSALIGLLAAPLANFVLFVLFWVLMIVSGVLTKLLELIF